MGILLSCPSGGNRSELHVQWRNVKYDTAIESSVRPTQLHVLFSHAVSDAVAGPNDSVLDSSMWELLPASFICVMVQRDKLLDIPKGRHAWNDNDGFCMDVMVVDQPGFSDGIVYQSPKRLLCGFSKRSRTSYAENQAAPVLDQWK